LPWTYRRIGWDLDGEGWPNKASSAFEHHNGNVQGYARQRSVAVSPIAAHPIKTLFHEIAHAVIGHTAEAEMRDDDRTPCDIRELEAEATAMLCCAALDLPGADDSRGYIQAWRGQGSEIPEASARRIFKTADAIRRAGRQEPHAQDAMDDPGERHADR
jgi:hypothetical protein